MGSWQGTVSPARGIGHGDVGNGHPAGADQIGLAEPRLLVAAGAMPSPSWTPHTPTNSTTNGG